MPVGAEADRLRRGIAWLVWASSIALALASLGLLAVSWGVHPAADVFGPDTFGFRGWQALYALTFSTVGLLILSRRNQLIGWLLLATGALAAVDALAAEYSVVGLAARPAFPGAAALAWLDSWIFLPILGIIMFFIPLLFPDGRLPSRRWRPVAIGGAIAFGWFAIATAIQPGPMQTATALENPFAVDAPWGAEAPFVGIPATTVFIISAALSLVYRFRSAAAVERTQIKWFAYGIGVVVPLVIAGTLLQGNKVFEVAAVAAPNVVAIAVGIAVQRYRLYDIDALVNRTLVYGALSAVLLGTYVLAVLVLSAVLRPFVGSSDLAVAGSTLAVVAAFVPLRAVIQRAVDRRFYRARYDAGRTADAFGMRLRHDVDLDALSGELIDVVHETLQPAQVSLWLRQKRGRVVLLSTGGKE